LVRRYYDQAAKLKPTEPGRIGKDGRVFRNFLVERKLYLADQEQRLVVKLRPVPRNTLLQ
jgi:hypothetical protein